MVSRVWWWGGAGLPAPLPLISYHELTLEKCIMYTNKFSRVRNWKRRQKARGQTIAKSVLSIMAVLGSLH